MGYSCCYWLPRTFLLSFCILSMDNGFNRCNPIMFLAFADSVQLMAQFNFFRTRAHSGHVRSCEKDDSVTLLTVISVKRALVAAYVYLIMIQCCFLQA